MIIFSDIYVYLITQTKYLPGETQRKRDLSGKNLKICRKYP